MNISVLKRNLVTVYSLVIFFSCLLEGCLSQSGEVISQVDKSSKDALLASKSGSSFNYFDSKKKYSPDLVVAFGKADDSFPNDLQVGYAEGEKPGRVKIVGHSIPKIENSEEIAKKTKRSTTDKHTESWRSKSLIKSAKKFPSKIAKTYHQKSAQTKLAVNSVTRGVSSRIQHIAKTVTSSVESDKTKKIRPDSESSVLDQIRTDELSGYFDQEIHQKATSQLTQLGKDLKRDLEQTKPTFEDVNPEMRRLQINAIMERAKQAAKSKNYEYALFLAEQAMESSYRGHVAFSPEAESPQKLLQQIKSIVPVRQDSEIKPIEHTKSKAKTNVGQSVPNFHFSPSAVHPLKRRSTVKPAKRRLRPEIPASPSQELPLITPRNRGIQQQRNTSKPYRDSAKQKARDRSNGIMLEQPTFEHSPQEQLEVPAPAESRAKTEAVVPEPVRQDTGHEVKSSTSPGPKLMLPNLPSMPQDLTSQTGNDQSHRTTMLTHSGQNQKTQTVPVKFRSKILENVKNERAPLAGQNSAGAKENRPVIASALVLDEIEWDLEEKRRPRAKGSWWGMSTVLLMIGGLIILLLLTIIILLLRRSNSPS
ncbi:MAG: hypothetical protein QM501_14265 [Gimesia sp.]